MRLVFKKNYRQYAAGDIIEVGSGVAEEYLRRGLVDVVETAVRHDVRERAAMPTQRRRR